MDAVAVYVLPGIYVVVFPTPTKEYCGKAIDPLHVPLREDGGATKYALIGKPVRGKAIRGITYLIAVLDYQYYR